MENTPLLPLDPDIEKIGRKPRQPSKAPDTSSKPQLEFSENEEEDREENTSKTGKGRGTGRIRAEDTVPETPEA